MILEKYMLMVKLYIKDWIFAKHNDS